jgi:hypothetical protein
MSGPLKPMERRLRVAGIVVLFGLLLEAVSLVWDSPLSFVLVLMGGAALMVAGIVYYLISLVTVHHRQ